MARIDRLRRALRHQWESFRRTGKRGHARQARRIKRDIARLEAVRVKARRRLKRYLRPGPPGWGGGKLIVAREVWPIVRAAGISPTSGKRRETFGNPGSDHFVGNIWAFAKDFATEANFELAQRIRTALDGGRHVDYESFYISRFGHTYRVQIIAGTHGTGPHLHVGVRRES
jgi:hypothetical protein